MKVILHPDRVNSINALKWACAESGERAQNYAIGFTAVAWIGGRGDDWAAYWCPVGSSPEYACEHGDKMLESTANRIFPMFVDAGLEYRP